MDIGIDIDQTIVGTNDIWNMWIYLHFGVTNPVYENYTLFWQNKFLYDDLVPFGEANRWINKLSEHHKIWFISKCFKEHKESKISFIDKYFDYDIFIDIEHKGLLDGKLDYMIDDREIMLEQFSETDCIKISHTHEKETKFKTMSWEEIYNLIQRK